MAELLQEYEMPASTSYDYINLAGVVSALAVVMLHTNGCFWDFSATESYWKSANVIESVCYFAVPVFFMISGATLLDFFEKYDMKTYFSKRIAKTVVPYVFWSLIGIMFHLAAGSLKIEQITAGYVADGLLRGNIVSVYWFFPPLFCVYLCIPLFAAVEKSYRKTVFIYLVISGLILNITIPFFIGILQMNIGFGLSVPVVGGNLLLVLTGYLISHFEIPPRLRLLFYAAGLAGLLVHCIGTYRLSMQAGEVVRTFKGYTNITCFPYAVAVFTAFKYGGNKVLSNRLIGKLVNTISNYTFALYLLHVFVLRVLVWILRIDTHSLVYRLAGPFVILPIVMIGTRCLRMIPGLRRVVP